MYVVLPIEFEQLTLDEDLWCTACAKSTGVRLWFTITIGVRATLRDSAICRECGGREIED